MRKATSPMAARVLPVLLTGALCAGMFGCSLTGVSEAASVGSGGQEALAESEGGATDSSVPVLDETAYDFSYSNRDLDASYDESSATKVALSGSSATVDGAGAALRGSALRSLHGKGVLIKCVAVEEFTPRIGQCAASCSNGCFDKSHGFAPNNLAASCAAAALVDCS